MYTIYWKFRKTFDIENDTFRLEFLLVPVMGLSFLVNYSYAPMEVSVIPRQRCLPSTFFQPSCLPTMSPLLTIHSIQPYPTVREHICSVMRFQVKQVVSPPRVGTLCPQEHSRLTLQAWASRDNHLWRSYGGTYGQYALYYPGMLGLYLDTVSLMSFINCEICTVHGHVCTIGKQAGTTFHKGREV